MHRTRSRHHKVQLCDRRGNKLVPRACTADGYEVAFESKQPYYVLPEKRSMLQKIAVVKVRAVWLSS